MLHSTAGVRQLRCYSERGTAFAESGVAALQFDCRGFGASEGEPRQLYDVRRMAEDLEAALEFALGREDLDPSRLALWGGSASCAQVLDAARRRDDVRAVVCLTPFMTVGREPRGVAVGGAPGEEAILVRENAAAGERNLLPPGARIDPSGDRAELDGGVVWENRVVLRPRLRNPNPLRLAAEVECPLLVLTGERDTLCPPGPAAQLARRAPASELETFPCGHFELYAGRSIPAEAGFLRRHLVGAG
jgi:pimeloyl-ACP methyl ester carboxylesterase